MFNWPSIYTQCRYIVGSTRLWHYTGYVERGSTGSSLRTGYTRYSSIRTSSGITCRPPKNPADLGSRGGSVDHHQLWNKGPSWLSEETEWPPDIILEPNTDSNAELKVTRSVFAATAQVHDDFDRLLDAHKVHKVLRICAWIQRFISNCRSRAGDRQDGPLNATEIEQQRLWWTKEAQLECQETLCFKQDQLQLNLQLNSEDIFECTG